VLTIRRHFGQHPPICYCPACKKAYRADTVRAIPARADLKDIAYRQYLVWRGEKLEQHYRALKARLGKARPGAVLMTWTVNAGRYGHFLHSPRAMPTALNRVIDLPMQEWWLDETNQGASVAPAFGAAYLRAVSGDGPCASEPYLMSRGNPYGTDSFPHHERLARTLLALTYGSVAAHSVGWPGHRDSTRAVFRAVERCEKWVLGARSLPWAGLLVSEQTRQFYAFEDIAGRFLPHVFGAFRAALEEHLPLTLVNDWDLTARDLSRFGVLILPGSAALSDAQVAAVRAFVKAGGGLVASSEASLCDEIGRPRKDFALADLFGVSYQGRPAAPLKRPALDANFAVALDAGYWKQRVGVARLRWDRHPLVRDSRLQPQASGLVAISSVGDVAAGRGGGLCEQFAQAQGEARQGGDAIEGIRGRQATNPLHRLVDQYPLLFRIHHPGLGHGRFQVLLHLGLDALRYIVGADHLHYQIRHDRPGVGLGQRTVLRPFGVGDEGDVGSVLALRFRPGAEQALTHSRAERLCCCEGGKLHHQPGSHNRGVDPPGQQFHILSIDDLVEGVIGQAEGSGHGEHGQLQRWKHSCRSQPSVQNLPSRASKWVGLPSSAPPRLTQSATHWSIWATPTRG
jgi:hypothetical protein